MGIPYGNDVVGHDDDDRQDVVLLDGQGGVDRVNKYRSGVIKYSSGVIKYSSGVIKYRLGFKMYSSRDH